MSNITEMNQVFTVGEVCDLLLCDYEDVIDLAKRGELPGVNYGGEWVFPQSSLFKVLHVESLKQMSQRKGNKNG